jgi:uncharacterized protein (TIGR02453 family)
MAEFTGFGPGGMAFLSGLAAENDKAFFDAHRATYEADLKAPLASLVETVSTRCAIEGLPFRGSAKSTFRINRDVRFSKDKSPYQTHVSAVLTPSGDKKDMSAVLYFQFGVPEAFAATGFWQPEPARLQRLRQTIADDPDAFAALEDTLAASGLALAEGNPLKRMPGGFEQVTDDRAAAAIRKRSFTLDRHIPHAVWQTPDLPDHLMDFARAAMPFLDWAKSAGLVASPAEF